ncbi:MAG: hypothetical protein M1820_009965 [Bogoriella megaspora]|nr:MAG: hypothetical protein M1820_009965 [Bogoriella megaspora]
MPAITSILSVFLPLILTTTIINALPQAIDSRPLHRSEDSLESSIAAPTSRLAVRTPVASAIASIHDVSESVNSHLYDLERSSQWDRRAAGLGFDDESGEESHQLRSYKQTHTIYHQSKRPPLQEAHDNPEKLHNYEKSPTFYSTAKRSKRKRDVHGCFGGLFCPTMEVEKRDGPSRGKSRLRKRVIGAHANSETFPPRHIQMGERQHRKDIWRAWDEAERTAKEKGMVLDPESLTPEERRLGEGQDPGEQRLTLEREAESRRKKEEEDRRKEEEKKKEEAKRKEAEAKEEEKKEGREKNGEKVEMMKRTHSGEEESEQAKQGGALMKRVVPLGDGTEWKPAEKRETDEAEMEARAVAKGKARERRGFWHWW